MSNVQVDSLSIDIKATAQQATTQIDTLVSKLGVLSQALQGVQGNGLSSLAAGVSQLAGAMATLNNSGVKTQDFTRLTNNLNKLSGLQTQNLANVSGGLVNLVNAINGLQGISANAQSVGEFAKNISKLGNKSVQTAIANIPQLAIALRNLMSVLSQAPTVSANVIQMTNALANLSANGQRVGSASASIVNGLNRTSVSARSANKSMKSLTATIGLFYAKFFIVMRGIKALWKGIDSSMDYLETLNYFDAGFGQVAQNAVNDWSQAGYDSADAYYQSFTERAKEVTSKMSGYTISGDGSLTTSGKASLGINPEELLKYQTTFAQLSSSIGVTSEKSLVLSQALTELGADLASVKNMNFADTWENLASALMGQARVADKYGVNLRSAALQQKLLELGINANIQKLSQQDKVLLRTIVLLDSTKYAWADLSDTIQQPANQMRLLSANMQNLGRTIGNIFLPAIAKLLPYINGVVIALQRLFTWIAKLLGVDLSGLSSSIGSVDISKFTEDTEDASDNLGNAAKNAEKLNKTIRAFDELNVISSKKDTGSGSGGLEDTGLLDDAFKDAFSRYQEVWDAAFARLENKAEGVADNIANFFKNIANEVKPATDAIKDFWNNGLSQIVGFSATALIDFYNDFLMPVAKWTVNTAIPKFLSILQKFINTVNWAKFNSALDKLYKVLAPFVTGIGNGLLMFLGGLADISATALNIVIDVLDALFTVLSKIPPSVIESLGVAIGVFVGYALTAKALSSIPAIITNVGTAFGKLAGFFGTTASSIAIPAAVITGAIALIGAYNDAVEKAKKKDISDMFDSLKNSGEPIENLINDFDNLANGIQGSVDKISGGLKDISLPKQEIKETSDNIEYMFKAIDLGATNLPNSIDTIISEFTRLKDDTATLLTTVADNIVYALVSTPDAVNAAIGADVTSYIATTLGISDDAVNRLEELQKQADYLKEQFDKNLISENDFATQFKAVVEEIQKINGIFDDKLDVDDFVKEFNKFGEIDFSTFIDGNKLDTTKVNEFFDDFGKKYTETKDLITQTYAEILGNTEQIKQYADLYGMDYSEVVSYFESVQGYYLDELNASAQEFAENMEYALYSQIEQYYTDSNNVTFGNQASTIMYDNLIKPFNDAMKESFNNIGFTPEGLDDLLGKDFITNLWNQLGGNLTEGLSSDYYTAKSDEIAQAIELLLQESITGVDVGIHVETLAHDFVDGYAKALDEGIVNDYSAKSVQAWIQSLIDKIAETQDSHSPSKETYSLAEDFMQGYFNGITDNTDGVVTVVGGFVQTALDTLNVKTSAFYEVGANIVEGIRKGIEKGSSALLSSMKNLANNLVGTVTSTLDIHSPSRVFAKLGEYTIEGFQLGMEGMYYDAQSSLKNFTSGLADVNTDFSFNNAKATVSSVDFDSAFSNSSAENSLQTSLLRELITAVNEGKVIEIDGDVLGNTVRRKGKEYYMRTGNNMYVY